MLDVLHGKASDRSCSDAGRQPTTGICPLSQREEQHRTLRLGTAGKQQRLHCITPQDKVNRKEKAGKGKLEIKVTTFHLAATSESAMERDLMFSICKEEIKIQLPSGRPFLVLQTHFVYAPVLLKHSMLCLETALLSQNVPVPVTVTSLGFLQQDSNACGISV